MSVGTGRKAVAIGGGTGLPAVLGCLLELGFETTAVVTMADDGGSTGRLREQLGMLPPGDIRNCLVAMAENPDGMVARMFQYRFPEGEGLAGHALGNLVIAALSDVSHDFPAAIAAASDLLKVRGRVLPSTLEDIRLHGVDRAGNEISGQAALACNPEAVARAFLEPSRPKAYPPAIDAIREADVILIGPGSLYTSLIPNFLVDGIADAVRRSRAARIYVCNVANMRGETVGLDAGQHVEALAEHGLSGAIDTVIVHDPCKAPTRVCDDDSGVEPVNAGPEALARIAALNVDVVAANVADADDPVRHSRKALCRVIEKVVS